ncbi:MAG: hypothetical protein AAFV29_05275, partial [Myxococcota bacterium]
MRPSPRSLSDLSETLNGALNGLPEADRVMASLGQTIRSNIPQQLEHPSHEVIVDDWSHRYALAQNRRINHALKQVVLTVARRLDEAELGRLRLGRRGRKTRFSLPPNELATWLEVIAPDGSSMA